MNAPKIVLHAALAGGYGAALLALFLWIANGGGASGARAATLLPVVIVYACASAIVWPLLYGALRFFASTSLRVPWFGLRYLMGFHAVNTGVLLLLCWQALARSRPIIDAAAYDRLEGILMAVGLGWAYAAVVSIVPRLRRSASLQSSAAGIALAAILAPAWSRPAPPPLTAPPAPAEAFSRTAATGRRLILLNFDGADLEDILTLLAQGKLPAFSRLKEEGTFGRLRTLLPCETAVTRTTLATGKFPLRHRVASTAARRLGARAPWIGVVPDGIAFDLLLAPLLEKRNLTVADRSTRALWDMVAQMGGESVAAGWEVDLDQEPPGPLAPGPDPQDARALSDLLDGEGAPRERAPSDPLILDLARAARADAPVQEALRRALSTHGAGVVALSFPGIDAVAHTFLRYARPQEFGNVTSGEIALYGGVLERYYRRLDALVGRALTASDPSTMLFVTSSHGIDPTPLLGRLLATASGAERRSGTHAGGPGGFLFVRGPDVRGGVQFEKGSITDVVPTALYALNLPVAGDLDGAIRAGIFTARYTFDHPATVIATYESAASSGEAGGRDAPSDLRLREGLPDGASGDAAAGAPTRRGAGPGRP